MKQPHNSVPVSPDPDRARLARWLAEWELFRALASATDDDAGAPTDTPRGLSPLTGEAPVTTGDIRLLHPRLEPGGPRYIGVIANTDSNTWIVVPFGLLAEPATPEEVITGRDTPALRVLCPWNQFSMSTTMLQYCWRVDRLTDTETALCQTALPVGRIGPPLRHPLDPRWDYLEMESEFRQRVCSADRGQVTYEIPYPSELRKAAEDGAPYGNDSDGAKPEDENGDA